MSVVFWDDFLNWEARRILVDRRGAHVVGTGTIEIRPAEVPAFGDDDVLVKMLYCGVCGSGGRVQFRPEPFLLYEFSFASGLQSSQGFGPAELDGAPSVRVLEGSGRNVHCGSRCGCGTGFDLISDAVGNRHACGTEARVQQDG